MRKATNIQWDNDDCELVELPDTMNIPDEIDEEDIADYLSDQTGWLVFGFDLEY